ncbi:bacterial proteasome activator family protein [Ornithinimicrobium cryptoxanthini]|nr:bacterial proteasome activator family protein [Ornithinimicrobium cryptoxanthini]
MTEHTPQDQPSDKATDQASDKTTDQAKESDGQAEQRRIVVVTQDGMGVASPEGADAASDSAETKQRKPTELVEQPAKVMRLGTMIKQLLEEVKDAPLDEAGRARLAEIHRRSLTELEQGLAPELVEELERITLPLADGTPSEAELRIAQAQLVGWLEGLFHGIQTAIVAQQMAAQQQLQQIRLGLPGGAVGPPGAGMIPGQPPGQPGSSSGPDDEQPTGQYL